MTSSKDHDRLEVVVLEAQGLLPIAGGVANPYISAEVDGELRKTAVETGTVDPVWNDIMVFSVKDSSNMEHLVLTVKHHDPAENATHQTLGIVTVDMAAALEAPGTSTQEWHPVSKGPGVKGGDSPQGRVHVKVTYFENSLDEEGESASEGSDGEDDDIDTKPPNVVTILVEAGRNLHRPGSKGLCDAMVVLRCGGKTKQCKAQNNTNDPKWHFQAQMANANPREPLVVEVQHDGFLSNKFIGQARLTMFEIQQAGESFTKWLPLLDEKWGFDEVSPRGEVMVTARWRFDKKFMNRSKGLPVALKRGKSSREMANAKEELQEMEEEDRETERQAMAASVELEKKRDAIIPGAYHVQVHVIEVSDLKGKDFSDTSDPIVYASCLGMTKHTSVKQGVTSAVFDEVLHFNFTNLSRAELKRATLNMRVLDANTFRRDSLIGSHQFDLLGVYVEDDHEVYRSWVGLVETETGLDNGFQGFLKLSVTVLGANDKQRVHNLAEELQEEMAKEAEVGRGKGKGGMILRGPAPTAQELSFLVVYVFSAQDLPNYSTLGVPSIAGFVQVDFAGNSSVRTTTVKARGRNGLSPGWMQELWLPVMAPPNSTTIELSVWNKELVGRTVVARAYFDFDNIEEKFGRTTGSAQEWKTGFFQRRANTYPGPDPVWTNLYGAPAGKENGREPEMMNRYPRLGSTYRGGVLLAMRVETRPPSSIKTRKAIRSMEYEVPSEILPETTKYTLRAVIFQGSDIPVFRILNTQASSKMRIVVTLGPTEIDFGAKVNSNGYIEWNRAKELHALELPADPAQVPDAIIYLVRDMQKTRVCFGRIPAVTLLSQRFSGEPYWQDFLEDKAQRGPWSLESGAFPGSVLLRLGLGTDNDAQQHPWEEMDSLSPKGSGKDGDVDNKGTLGPLGKKKPYCLRVHVFQCRDLPSSDANGLLDPYVKVRFMGQSHETTKNNDTVHPCFYQTMEFHQMLPSDLEYAAEIRLEVWDDNRFGDDNQVAGCRFPVSAATLSSDSSGHVPTPCWHHLRDTDGEPGMGEILISLQLIPKQAAKDKLPQAPSILPTLRTAFLEIITVGVRDLKPFGFQAVAQPYVHFQMTSGGERVSFNTRASEFPSGKNANFLERKVLSVLLPDDPLYAPHLSIRVEDKRMSGLTTSIAGICSVSLDEKIPWNHAGYRPPQTELFTMGKIGQDDDAEGGVPSVDDDEEAYAETDALLGSGDRASEKRGKEEEEAWARAGSLGREGGGVDLDRLSIEDDASFDGEMGLQGLSAQRSKSSLEIAPEEGKSRTPGNQAWYERLISQGENFLGIIDTEEEDEKKVGDLNITFPRDWASDDYMGGRNWWLKQEGGGSEIENFLKNSPFENYPLFLGAEKLKGGIRLFPQAHRRQVGVLKGLVVISETSPDPKFSEFVDMARLQTPQTYCCRLYVVKALNLQPKDLNGAADPYLLLKIGKKKFDDSSDENEIKRETLKPQFFRSFDVQVTMPGDSRLKLKLFDHDRFGVDDLMGETVIDLEDRWFSRGWQELEKEDPLALKRSEAKGGPYKPLEVRDLSVLSSTTSQGQVMMWLDILTLTEAQLYPPVKLEPPTPTKFEVRVVCWRSEDVVACDDFTGLRDLYCKLWMETDSTKKRETDTHWRCRNGKGSWNYRIKFDVELPLKSPEHGRLVFQMWDRDVLSPNNIIAETSINLYKWFLKAYREQQSIKPYMVIKNARKKKAHVESLARPARSEDAAAVSTGGGTPSRAFPVHGSAGSSAGPDSGKKGATPKGTGVGSVKGSSYSKSPHRSSFFGSNKEGNDEEKEAMEEGRASEYPSVNDPTRSEEKKNSEREDQPLLGSSAAGNTLGTQDAQTARRKHLAKVDETDELVDIIKAWFGYGNIRDDATWLELTKRDAEAGTVERMGKMLISLELLPKEAADAQPVGVGRNQPNQNPYLPPPTGRMKFSFNPCTLAVSLLGRKGCFKVACCLLCLLFIVLLYFFGNFITMLSVLL
ncbi:unnamed protein product [Ascophyllum nodosum]